MTPGEKYLELEKRHLEIRIKNGPVDSQEEDDIMDEMDPIWWEMSDEERAEANARTPAYWGELMKNPEWQEFFKNKTQKKEPK